VSFETLTPIFLGVLLGLRHATDADHVVAVTTIVAREKSLARAAWVGVVWGLGHTLTLLLLGGAIIAFRIVIPPRIGLGLEFAVALMLIGLGFSNIRQRREEATPKLTRPLLIGIVHGLAGSAAVALLVLSTIRTPFAAATYLLMFGFGTVIGMMIVTALLAVPALFVGERVVKMRVGVRYAAGALSIAFGLLLAHQLVIDGGMFSESPTWNPR
jgi:sulfite exporter TauE/SafE